MAKAKDPAALSPAYARRLERERAKAAAEGRAFDRKRARGKTADEAAVRRARKKAPPVGALGDITPGQKAAITRYAKEQGVLHRLSDAQVKEIAAAMRKHAMLHGYALTSEMMHAVRARQKQALQEQEAGTYIPLLGLLEQWRSTYKVDDLYWLYYHGG